MENNHRKETEQLILKQVTDTIENSESIKNSRVMVVAGEGWHHGVIGIVSSRIKDMYYRPNILLSIEDGVATGSARSIEGFNLFEALCTCSDLMLKFGGHAAAAGMSLKAENIAELSRRMNDYAMERMDNWMMTPVQKPEAVLQPSEISSELIALIEKMEPFGQDMPEPIVEVKGLLSEVRAVGADGNTLRMKIMDERKALTAVGFRRGIMKNYYDPGVNVSIAGNLGINVYMDREYPQIIIKDVHVELPKELERLNRIFTLRHVTDDYKNYCDHHEKISKTVCQDIYRFLAAHARRQGTADEGCLLMEDIPSGSGKGQVENIFGLMQALSVFEELGLVRAEASGPYLHYQLIRGKTAKLSESGWYQKYYQD